MSTLRVNNVQNTSGDSILGTILQTKIGVLSAALNGTSGSWTDMGISAQITLSSTSSKLLISLSTTPYLGGSSGERFGMQVLYTPSGGSTSTAIQDNYYAYRTNDDWKSSSGHHQALVSPSSTALITVKAQYIRYSGGDTLHLFSSNVSNDTIVLQEVAA